MPGSPARHPGRFGGACPASAAADRAGRRRFRENVMVCALGASAGPVRFGNNAHRCSILAAGSGCRRPERGGRNHRRFPNCREIASIERAAGAYRAAETQLPPGATRSRTRCSSTMRLCHRGEMMVRAGLSPRRCHRRRASNRKPTGSCAVPAVGYVSARAQAARRRPAMWSHPQHRLKS
jgi:hypothetical protein